MMELQQNTTCRVPCAERLGATGTDVGLETRAQHLADTQKAPGRSFSVDVQMHLQSPCTGSTTQKGMHQ
jgi:hypothetical protein